MKISLRVGREPKYLKHGEEYTVFAVYFNSPIEFMVMVDALPSAPYAVKIDDVNIVDNRISRHWVFGFAATDNSEPSNKPSVLAFSEWANDLFFYQDLLDGGKAGDVWRKYKDMMELEFADSSLSVSAQPQVDGWVECGSCTNIWLPSEAGEVVVCPSCSTKQNLKTQKNQ